MRIVRFLSFLQNQSNPVTAVCTFMGTVQTGTANSYSGIVLMVPISQNVNKQRLKILGSSCSPQLTNCLHGNIILPVYILKAPKL